MHSYYIIPRQHQWFKIRHIALDNIPNTLVSPQIKGGFYVKIDVFT